MIDKSNEKRDDTMKIRKMMTIFLTMTLGAGFFQTAAFAETTINERWGKPTFVSGAGLTDSQRAETMEILGITEDEVKATTATGADLIKYLGSGSGDDSVMLSSVVVNREDQSKGIEVDILTPENITLITADQYKNPLVTAGITDATVKVASVSKVTGESALTGVYKAFDTNGDTIDPERAQLAQEELATTSDVAESIVDQANQDNSDAGLSAEEQAKADEAYRTQLNQTLVDIKQSLAELNDQQGELATKEDIEKIVNDALSKNNLTQYISQADIDKLVALAEKYQTTDGVLSEESLQQLTEISKGFQNTVNQLGNELGKFGNSLKGTFQDNQGFFSGLWQSITDFFSNVGDNLKNLFN